MGQTGSLDSHKYKILNYQSVKFTPFHLPRLHTSLDLDRKAETFDILRLLLTLKADPPKPPGLKLRPPFRFFRGLSLLVIQRRSPIFQILPKVRLKSLFPSYPFLSFYINNLPLFLSLIHKLNSILHLTNPITRPDASIWSPNRLLSSFSIFLSQWMRRISGGARPLLPS